MRRFIEIIDIQNNKYVINTKHIIYIEELYSNEAKTLVVMDRELPICKNGVLKEPNNLYVKNEYNTLRDWLV